MANLYMLWTFEINLHPFLNTTLNRMDTVVFVDPRIFKFERCGVAHSTTPRSSFSFGKRGSLPVLSNSTTHDRRMIEQRYPLCGDCSVGAMRGNPSLRCFFANFLAAMADCGIAEDVLNLLRSGALLPESFGLDAEATAAAIAPFLPALALAAHDFAAVDPRLLAALAYHSDTPCAFAYAGLDYGESFLARIHGTLASGGTLASAAAEGTSGRERDAWAWSDDGEDAAALDECDAFQQGDEVMCVNCNDLCSVGITLIES